MMSIVDANIILRYLLDDHAELSPRATEILEQETPILPIEVACEVVYVLQKVYSVDRKEIQENLCGLLDIPLVSMDKPTVLRQALEYYSRTKLDFVDTLLWAYHTVESQTIFTFDEKLKKYIQQKSIEKTS
jgi:predicted nucleic-acid-binding protein